MGDRQLRRLSEVAPGQGSARRFVPTGLKDARWIVGVILLALGVLGTLRVIGSFDHTVQVWRARSALVPGERLETKDLVSTSVRLESGAAAYLDASNLPAGVIQRPVGAGELVPAAALGQASDVDVRSVSVTLDRGQADVVRPGADVEVWVARKRGESGSGGFEEPQQLVDRALVAHVGSRNGGVVAVAEGQPVEILVPQRALAKMIDAVNSGAKITLVPVAGGASS